MSLRNSSEKFSEGPNRIRPYSYSDGYSILSRSRSGIWMYTAGTAFDPELFQGEESEVTTDDHILSRPGALLRMGIHTAETLKAPLSTELLASSSRLAD